MLFATSAFFLAPAFYLIFKHPKDAFFFFAKSAIIGLFTIPIYIAIIFISIFLPPIKFAAWLYQKLSRSKTPPQPDENYMSTESIGTHIHVYLIHGTFEPKAPWTHPDSAMHKAISRAGDRFRVLRFEWSGSNSRRKREHDSERLSKLLEESSAAQNYIVAHSHAGNLVDSAILKNYATTKKICGICYLSTPFIIQNPISRNAKDFILMHGLGFILSAQFTLFCAYFPFFLLGRLPLPTHNVVLGAFIATTLIGYWTEAILTRRFEKDFFTQINATREVKQKNYPRKALIIQALGDEADSVLRITSVLHEICFGTLSHLQKIAESEKSHKLVMTITYYAVFSIIVGLAYIFLPKSFLLFSAYTLIGLILSIVAQLWLNSTRSSPSSLLLLAALPLLACSFLLGVAKAIAYGDLRLIFLPNIFIASSETPIGEFQLSKYGVDEDNALRHSTHSKVDVIEKVAEWILESSKEIDQSQGAKHD